MSHYREERSERRNSDTRVVQRYVDHPFLVHDTVPPLVSPMTTVPAEAVATVEAAIINDQLRPRSFPEFTANELSVGPVLGKGAFGVVYEVRRIELHVDEEQKEITTSAAAEDASDEDEQVHDNHYDVASAKHFMVDHFLRDGKDARYAVKHLRKKNTSESDRDRAMMDLAIEARILSMLLHPNIIKMRGQGCYLQPECFIVMDRLYDTLEVRIGQWRQQYSLWAKRSEKQLVQRQRLAVAYDVASAFRYLKKHNIVYRDVKQENMGFDVRGDIKVFDFGLAKCLDGVQKTTNGYLLTARTGTIPYMAPEVVLAEPYSAQCDVYSLAILFYELWSTQDAFAGYTKASDYTNRCVVQGRRPSPLPRSMPRGIRNMLPSAWVKDPHQRATVTRLFEAVAADWYAAGSSRSSGGTSGSSALAMKNRDQYMMEKSMRSQRQLVTKSSSTSFSLS